MDKNQAKSQQPSLLPRSNFEDDRGRSIFDAFPHIEGQINVAFLEKDKIKAFHRHAKQDDYWLVADGLIKAILVPPNLITDVRDQIKTYILSAYTPQVLYIPAGWWHGYKALKSGVMLYHVTRKYDPKDPDEERRGWDWWGKQIWEDSPR